MATSPASGPGVTSAAPSGAAGGDLSGTYPNPAVAAGAITDAKVNAAAALAASKLSGFPNDATKFLSGAGTWLAAGGSLPNSWLVAAAAAGRTTTGSFSWLLNGNVGADINIDGTDATIINIVTSGFYACTVQQIDTVGDATGAGVARVDCTGTFDDDSTSWPFQGSTSLTVVTVIPPSFEDVRSYTFAPFKVTAPVTFKLTVNIATSAGTVTVGAGIAVAVVRLA